MKLRVGILGTRGIPNFYGGFEQFAEYLSAGLAAKGHEVYVYNSHNHPYQKECWNNVHIVHCYDPETKLGTAGQFIYDFNCIMDARKKNFDVILMLGFTSSSIWGWLYPANSTIIFNMDGLEWKRTKYSRFVQKFLLQAEKLAIKYANAYIADSEVIQTYLFSKYGINSEYIAYGAEVLVNEDEEVLKEYNVQRDNYFLLIARLEPENNIETILDGFHATATTKFFLVIGDTNNKFGKYLLAKYKNDARIKFAGGIYNNYLKLHSLKAFCFLYFHGHSVGGTNPSLLEAMASQALIVAHNNPFNESILGNDAFYFSSAADVKRIIEEIKRNGREIEMIENNLDKIHSKFNWNNITNQYEKFILNCLKVKGECPPVPNLHSGGAGAE